MAQKKKPDTFSILMIIMIIVALLFLFSFLHAAALLPMLLDMLSMTLLIIALVSLPRGELPKMLSRLSFIHPPTPPTMSEGRPMQSPNDIPPLQQPPGNRPKSRITHRSKR